METFSALLAFCAQRPVSRSFDVFFDMRLNKGLSKQSWRWWFETPSSSLWRHRNEYNHNKAKHNGNLIANKVKYHIYDNADICIILTFFDSWFCYKSKLGHII